MVRFPLSESERHWRNQRCRWCGRVCSHKDLFVKSWHFSRHSATDLPFIISIATPRKYRNRRSQRRNACWRRSVAAVGYPAPRYQQQRVQKVDCPQADHHSIRKDHDKLEPNPGPGCQGFYGQVYIYQPFWLACRCGEQQSLLLWGTWRRCCHLHWCSWYLWFWTFQEEFFWTILYQLCQRKVAAAGNTERAVKSKGYPTDFFFYSLINMSSNWNKR